MKRRKHVVAILAAGALAIFSSGCGDDEEDTTPSLSVPEVTTTPSAPETTTTVPAPTETTGGTPTTKVTPTVEDSETNDIPPPPGSPQAQFEKQCKKNPAACG